MTVRQWVRSLAVLSVVLGTDVVIKAWAQGALTQPVRITDWLYLALHRNPEILFGAVAVSSVSFAYWSAMLGAVAWLGWRMATTRHPGVGIGYALVAGGLVGNLVDRAGGAVVDYVAFGPVAGERWAFVNLADLALLGGGIVLGTVLIRRKLEERGRSRPSGPSKEASGEPMYTHHDTR